MKEHYTVPSVGIESGLLMVADSHHFSNYDMMLPDIMVKPRTYLISIKVVDEDDYVELEQSDTIEINSGDIIVCDPCMINVTDMDYDPIKRNTNEILILNNVPIGEYIIEIDLE